MIAWLLACVGTPTAPGATGTSEVTGSPEDTGDAAPVIPLPAELADEDPAEGTFAGTLVAAMRGTAYAYNDQVPGPTIRVRAGDALTIEFENRLAVSTSVHWHGIDVPVAMDGSGMFGDAIGPGGSFTFAFTASRPGTYWYHPHVDVAEQIDLGLYGAVVVEDAADADVPDAVLFADVPGEFEGTVAETVEGDMDTGVQHGGMGSGSAAADAWTINGVTGGTLELDAPTRLRIVNASNTAYLALPEGVVLAGDQGPYGSPTTEAPVLAPGDRVELPGSGTVVYEATRYSVDGGAALGDAVHLLDVVAPEGAIALAHDGGMPTADPGTTDAAFVFQGGEHGAGFLLNGETWPDVTPVVVALGSRPIFEIRNLSSQEHPFHVHGNRFEVLSIDGVAPGSRRFEDTVNVKIRQRVRVQLHADNPGDWLVHCHVLEHETGGMMTLLQVR